MDLAAADAAVERGARREPERPRAPEPARRRRASSPTIAPGFEAAKKEVLARNAEYSQMYSNHREFAEWEHRYDDIVAMMKEAVALDPEGREGLGDARADRDARRGRDERARRAQDARGRKTTSTSASYNTLNLYDDSRSPRLRDRRPTIFTSVYAPEGREEDPRALRAAHARRGVGLDEGPLHLRADDAGAGRALRDARAVQRPHERPAQRRHPGRVLRARRRGDEPRRASRSTGATSSGTSSGTSSRSSSRRTTCRAGSPRG